ncbi:MAG: hypothetical protein JSR89_05735 [Proteobacteria bacterium]|nr:hypothetical protein [Pseudomonadota bacterium]
MKNFLFPVARRCAEIVEMTSNAAQDVWRGRSTDSITSIEKNTRKIPENNVIRRPSKLQKRPPLGSYKTYFEGESDTRSALAFDVTSFCSELEAWRASLISPTERPAEDERQSTVKYDDPVAADSRAELATSRSPKASASIENDVTHAVRNIERGLTFHPIARPSRSI